MIITIEDGYIVDKHHFTSLQVFVALIIPSINFDE